MVLGRLSVSVFLSSSFLSLGWSFFALLLFFSALSFLARSLKTSQSVSDAIQVFPLVLSCLLLSCLVLSYLPSPFECPSLSVN